MHVLLQANRFLCIVQGDFAISVTSVWIQLVFGELVRPHLITLSCLKGAFGPSQSVQPFSIYPPPDSTVIQQPDVSNAACLLGFEPGHLVPTF